MLDRPDWVDRANCAGLPQDVFFSEDSSDIDSARRICGRCVVQADCLAFAFETDETMREGVYGGTTGEERAAYAAARGIQPGRIVDRLRSPNSRRAWDGVQGDVQGDEHEDWSELDRAMGRLKGT